MDKVSKEKRSEIMGKVRSKETKLEQEFRKLLWQKGLHYRKNNAMLFGKPDISFRSKKIVIFIDSCFWHGCSEHLRLPLTNKEYWQKKIERNIERDEEVNKHYKKESWFVFRFWEHDLKNKNISNDLICEVTEFIKKQRVVRYSLTNKNARRGTRSV